jgi:hypothetical protein
VTYSQTKTLKDQQGQIKELSGALESRAKGATLEYQEKCARQAAEVFKADGWEKESMAGFENHYNEKTNKCFVLESNISLQTGMTSRHLFDAFERKNLANYTWIPHKGKKYWEVSPFECDVTLPSGEKKACDSSEQFEDLIKVYMQ